MHHATRRTLFWSPRILTVAFAVFLSIFALDVFDEAHGFAQTALALLMHLIPTLVILLVLALSWRHEWIAAIAFAALGVFYIATTWGRFPLITYVTIAGPLFVMAALFYANWHRRSEIRGAA